MNVLLVEDDCSDAKVVYEAISSIMPDRGCLKHVYRLADALALLDAQPFDAVVLDLSLPDSEGLDTLKRLRARVPHVPVIILSGWDSAHVAEKAIQFGADDYLVKERIHAGVIVRCLRYSIERRRAQQALHKAGSLLRSTLDAFNTCIAVLDEYGRIEIANASWRRRVDTAENLPLICGGIDDNYVTLCERRSAEGCADAAHMLDLLRKALRNGDTHLELEWAHETESSVRWFSARITSFPYGDAVRVIVAHDDISARKAVKEQLRKSEQRFRTITEMANDAIVTTDPEGRISYWNRAAVEIFGYSKGEAIGRDIRDLIFPSSRFGESMKNIIDVKEGGSEAVSGKTVELEAVRKNRTDFPVELSVSAFKLDGQWNTASIIRDVTERKTLERRLFLSERLESVGKLAGGIAHDFNNLLTVISGRIKLLSRGLPESNPLRRHIEVVEATTIRATSLTGRLLAFARKQPHRNKVLSINEVIAEMRVTLLPLLGENIELHTRLDPALCVIKADPTQLEQVILNLAINARDAMPAGGRLIVETASVAFDDDAAHRLGLQGGRYALLTVTDTGVGIPSEIQERIFEPFFSTKEQGKGTGLGLATVYGIVKQSSGHVGVRSKPGHGTVFEVYLPASIEVSENHRRAPSLSESSGGTETILLVEDEKEVQQLAREVLEEKGYTVIEASNGLEALDLAGRQAAPIHLLLTDVVMPGMGGPDLAKHLVEARPDLKVLFMSGFADHANLETLTDDTTVLQKPFDPELLERAVRNALDRS